MCNQRFWGSPSRILLAVLLLGGLLSTPGCGDNATGSGSDVDLEPFKLMAANATCADTRNRLFLIDDEQVFWDRAGTCIDAGFAQTLYGSTTSTVLSEHYDSVAGPMTVYEDENYRFMFDTMVANLDAANLGLGQEHSVQSVPF